MSRAFRVVTARGLNLRGGAGAHYPRLLVLERGDAAEVLGQAGPWIRIRAGTLEGWVADRYTTPHPTPWGVVMALEEAAGVRELPGDQEHPRIVRYHQVTTLKATRDEVAWCSAAACWCMEEVGIRSPRSAAARHWLAWGRAIAEPVPDCVAIFRRGGNPKQGHVAFYIGRDGDRILVRGGNQGNRVCIAAYRATELLGYRMPA